MLNEEIIQEARSRKRPYSLHDAGGLYLLIGLGTRRSWRYDYVIGGRERTLLIGQYPQIPLARARDIHSQACEAVKLGIEPRFLPARIQPISESSPTHSFRYVAEDWLLGRRSRQWRKMASTLLDREIYPLIGDRLITDIRDSDVRAVLQQFETRGATLTAALTLGRINQILDHGRRMLWRERKQLRLLSTSGGIDGKNCRRDSVM